MVVSSRGTYCTAGYFASFRVSALLVSAITMSPAVTRTRRGFGVMVMGWSGPGSFMMSRLFDRSALRGTLTCLYPDGIRDIVPEGVTQKAVHAKFDPAGEGTPARIDETEARPESPWTPTKSRRRSKQQ